MTISKETWLRYVNKLAEVNAKASQLMIQYVQKHGFSDTEELIATAFNLADYYGEAAAAAACDLYDAIAAAEGVIVPPAVPAQPATYGEVAKAVQGTMKKTPNQVPQTVGRLVKQAGADTMLQNAQRDGAQFAWVPHGDTCAFCMTLASRGWQYMSKKALKNGHAEHIHANCNCEYCVRFDGKSEVEGYDPEYYRNMYYGDSIDEDIKEAVWDKYGDSPHARMIAMRRQIEHNKKTENARSQAKNDKNISELIILHTKYGSPEGLMLMGSADELTRYNELKKESGLTNDQIRSKIFEEPKAWEGILSSQTKKQTDKLTDQLLDTATDDELHALRMWTGSTYGNINRMMRYGVEVDSISSEAARGIESVLDRVVTTEDMIVKRGTGTRNIFGQIGVSWGDNPAAFVGKTWTDNGFVATSPFKKGGFGGPGKDNAELFIFMPKGTHAAYIELESNLELEREMLIQRGYSYRIVRAEYRNNPYPQLEDEKDLKLWVELIP